MSTNEINDENESVNMLLRAGRATTKMNARIHPHGTRIAIPLEGRTNEAVFYPAARPHAPVLFGMHGGGFLLGGCALDDAMWTAMQKTLDVNIFSIGYRKTPDYAYPCALDDVYESILYLCEKGTEYDFDRNDINVFGNSAGATLATAFCLLAARNHALNIHRQILNYPFLDLLTDPKEKGDPEEELAVSRLYNSLYVADADASDPLISPLFASPQEYAQLPEAVLTFCENDTLRAEGEHYAEKLKAAGVTVYSRLAKDMPHAFFEVAFSAGPDSPEWKALRTSGRLGKETDATLAFIKEHMETS